MSKYIITLPAGNKCVTKLIQMCRDLKKITDLPSAAIKLYITPENSKWDKFLGDTVIMNIFQDRYFFFCSKLSQKLGKDAPQPHSLYFSFGFCLSGYN